MTDEETPRFLRERPWLVETTPGPVIVILSNLPGYDEKEEDSGRQAELSRCFRDGKERVDPVEAPDVVRLREKPKRLPDGFLAADGIFLVTGEVKTVIEGLDPDRHQFIPIRVTERNGTPIEKDWHVLVITHRQDTLLPEASDLRWSDPSGNGGTFLFTHPDHIALDLGSLDDSHLWRERQLQFGSTLFMSDALRTALKEHGLRVLRQHRTRKHP